MPHSNFGVFDLESYLDSDGINKVYAIGFMTVNDTNPQLFYLPDYSVNLDSNVLIISFIDALLVNKYKNYKFYNNLGQYDIYFI